MVIYMRRIVIALIACILATLPLASCNTIIKTVEVTRTVPQTVVVTKLVTQIILVNITATPLPTNTPIPATPTPQPTDTQVPTPSIDVSLQDPGIVVTQYYTLLGLHLFEQAYQLLDKHEQSNSSLEDFISGAEPSYKLVKVLQVVPYNDWIKQNHMNLAPVKKASVYHILVYVMGENLVEMIPQNGLENEFVYTFVENGQVKIEFNGATPYYYDNPQ